MSQSVVVSAKSLDEAITKGCAELGVGLDEVDFEVVEEGGLFRKMQVKVSIKEAAPVTATTNKTAETNETPETNEIAAANENTATAETDTTTEPVVEEFEIGGKTKPAKKAAAKPREVTEFDPNCPKFTKTLAFAEAFFKLMGDDLTVTTSHNDQEFIIAVSGDDVSRLIGKNGRTMAAINTIISSIAVNTHSGEPRRVLVDIENYREKRKDSLIALAKRKAEYVKKTGKSVKLDPMPARERVVVHLALQDVEGIITESEGVEPHRFLVIKPGAR